MGLGFLDGPFQVTMNEISFTVMLMLLGVVINSVIVSEVPLASSWQGHDGVRSR